MARKPRGTGDYAVGYGRPPVATRFKPGQSGNPKGRRKARRTVADDLHDALMAKVRVMESGRQRSYTAQQVIIRGLVAEAARKNPRAITALFALQTRYGATADAVLDPADLLPEDRAIIEGFIDQVRGEATFGADGPALPDIIEAPEPAADAEEVPCDD